MFPLVLYPLIVFPSLLILCNKVVMANMYIVFLIPLMELRFILCHIVIHIQISSSLNCDFSVKTKPGQFFHTIYKNPDYVPVKGIKTFS